MCSFGSSNASAPTSQYSTQTTVASPQAQAMYNTAWQNALTASQRPFNKYSDDPNAFVAPMNGVQRQATGDIASYQGASDPFYQAGAMMVGNAGTTTTPQVMNQYMNPYMSQVVDPIRAAVEQQQGFQRQSMNSDQIKNGAFGQERGQLMKAVLAGQQNLGLGQALAPAYQDAYKTGLGAAQADMTRQLQAGQVMGQLGQGYTQTGLGAAQALLGAGTLQQQTEQAGKNALYNQFMMQQMYPFQTAQFLASTAAGLGPGYGGTTSGLQSSLAPLSYMGNPLSDPDLKVGTGGHKPEVIGKTNDGQAIYRYRLVNPDTGDLGPAQIGLMADEVEKRRPDAIGDYRGYRTVDYEKATDKAARLGGGVKPEGGDYAYGGGVDDIVGAHKGMYDALAQIGSRGIVPESQIGHAQLATPSLSFASPTRDKKEDFLSSLGNTADTLLNLYKDSKEAKNIYNNWNVTPSPEKKAYGGLTGNDQNNMSYVPETGPMQQAHLDMPHLKYGSDNSDDREEGGGLGSALKTAAGVAGSLKTLWDIGSTVGPALMALSDPRLKTGVRPGRAEGGSIFDDIANAMAGHGYADGSTWERSAGEPMDIRPHVRSATGVVPHHIARHIERHAAPVAHHREILRDIDIPAHQEARFNYNSPGLGVASLPSSHFTPFPHREERFDYGSPGLGVARFAKGGPAYDDEDLDYLARTLVREAGGEGERGMEAVADVIRNRLGSGKYGSRIRDVVTAKNQFEPWNEKMRGTNVDPRLVDAGSDIYNKALGVGRRVMDGSEDITSGAMNFFNPKVVHPKWAAGKEGLDIGNHRFLDASGSPGAGVVPMAYAGKEGRPSSPGIDAIETGTIGKGVVPKAAAAANDDSSPASGLTGFFRGTPAKDMGEKAGDFLTSERFIVPLLAGLGGMASSQSRFLAPAILQGLGTGAQTYMSVQKAQADIAKAEEEARTQKAETAARTEMAPKIRAETRKQIIDNMRSSLFQLPGGGNVAFLSNGTTMSFADYMDALQKGNPPQLLGYVPENAAEIAQQSGAGASSPSQLPSPQQPTVPETPAAASPSEFYSPSSLAAAKAEARRSYNGGPLAESMARSSEEYRARTTSEASSARENAPYLKELASTLADAYSHHGLDEAGWKEPSRAAISSFANTLWRALGGDPNEDLSKLKDSHDIVNKISTLLSSGRNPHSYAELETLKNAIPNLEMGKEAGAELTAQLIALQQRAVDRDTHMRRYMRDSNGLVSDAGSNFEKETKDRYQKEQSIIRDMILNEPEVLKKMMSGTVSKEKIVKALKKMYGKGLPPDMDRYFPGAN